MLTIIKSIYESIIFQNYKTIFLVDSSMLVVGITLIFFGTNSVFAE